MKPKYYIATAIAYASAKPHIGNTYEIVLADSIARYKRSRGFDVYFQTGTDEHGEKIEQKAISAGISPKEYVDNISREIKNIWDIMNTSYDKFVRTTDEHHKKVVQHIFEYLYQKGDIYLGQYNGMYCTPCESFWTESQLVDGKCPDCGRAVEPRCEEAYFFKMSKYQDKLIEYIETHPEFIQPVSRKNEMINNFLKPGLQDLCVSRTTFDWGIRVPFNNKHVVYVWIDALTNYITNIGYDVNNESEEFKKWWPCDLHLIGKDIIRFHTIYWPILLMALDLPLPKQVFGHPWLLMNNDKMSKSKGNILYADDLVNLFGVDAIRYYLLHEIPFQNDGTISYELIIERINSDLANILGNLVNRTISMSQKYFDGEITNKNINDILDEEFIESIKNLPSEVDKAMEKLEIGNAIDKIFDVLRKSNKYIDDTTPWSLAKDDTKKERLETVLYNLLESIKVCGSELMPFLPDTSKEILRQINTELSNNFETSNKYNVLTPEPIFMRIDIEKKLEEINAKRS
ncbi:methionine--tRNA ligase [bacterium]|nr:methionine--tRNA ligase [bacterium]